MEKRRKKREKLRMESEQNGHQLEQELPTPRDRIFGLRHPASRTTNDHVPWRRQRLGLPPGVALNLFWQSTLPRTSRWPCLPR